jgi:hypothetical protein
MGRGLGLLLAGLSVTEADEAAAILAACSTLELQAGSPYFRPSFADSALLVVDEGFVVLRAPPRGRARSIIICEAGPGRLVLPPSPDEALFGLGAARLTAIPPGAASELLAVPGAAQVVLEQLAATVGREQEAIGNFGSTRHVERVRRKLLQLGRVSRDGIRIDFPVSHAVLAEMIGSSRETVTRAVDELERSGFVARRGHTYRLLVSPEHV